MAYVKNKLPNHIVDVGLGHWLTGHVSDKVKKI